MLLHKNIYKNNVGIKKDSLQLLAADKMLSYKTEVFHPDDTLAGMEI